jgi:hypothetical protein
MTTGSVERCNQVKGRSQRLRYICKALFLTSLVYGGSTTAAYSQLPPVPPTCGRPDGPARYVEKYHIGVRVNPAKSEVIDTSGIRSMSKEGAIRALESCGLTVVETGGTRGGLASGSGVPKDRVIGINFVSIGTLTHSTEVPRGSRVGLMLSDGLGPGGMPLSYKLLDRPADCPQSLTNSSARTGIARQTEIMPNVRTLELDAAIYRLDDRCIPYRVVYDTTLTTDEAYGTVVHQNIPPGTQVTLSNPSLIPACGRERVVLTIGGITPPPPQKLNVPYVLEDPYQSAERHLRDACFLPVTRFQPNPNVPTGTVISQEPAARGRADEGSQVVINVSAAVVPNVRFLTEAEAIAAIQKAGLVAQIVRENSGLDAGKVLAQSPVEGTALAPGSRVDVAVSAGPK